MPKAPESESRRSETAGTSCVGILMTPLRPANEVTVEVKLPWIWSLMGWAIPARDGSRAAISYRIEDQHFAFCQRHQLCLLTEVPRSFAPPCCSVNESRMRLLTSKRPKAAPSRSGLLAVRLVNSVLMFGWTFKNCTPMVVLWADPGQTPSHITDAGSGEADGPLTSPPHSAFVWLMLSS